MLNIKHDFGHKGKFLDFHQCHILDNNAAKVIFLKTGFDTRQEGYTLFSGMTDDERGHSGDTRRMRTNIFNTVQHSSFKKL